MLFPVARKQFKTKTFKYLNNQSFWPIAAELEDITINENTEITSGEDGPEIITRAGNITINESYTWSLSSRCKAWIIIINGDLIVNGTISMSEKGIERTEDFTVQGFANFEYKNNQKVKETIIEAAGQAEDGGILFIFVRGNLTIGENGLIEANGKDGGENPGTDGGQIYLYYTGTYSNEGTIEADAGTGTPAGTAGTITVEDISYELTEFQKELEAGEYIYCIEDLGNGFALVGMRDTGHVWRTENQGADWTDCGVLQSVVGDMTVRCFLKVTDTKILAGTGEKTPSQGKIYISNDKGETWELQATLGTQERVSCLLKIDENTYLAGTRSATNKARVYKTTNGGSSWSLAATLGTSNNTRALIRLSNGTILAGTRDGKIYKSENDGDSFTKKSTLTTKKIRAFYEVGSGVVLAGTWDAKIFRNTNYGEGSWTQVEYWNTKQEIVEFQEIVGDKILVSTSPRKESGTDSERHVAVSEDGGETWRRIEEHSLDLTNSYVIKESNILFNNIKKHWLNVPINHFGAT